jgi:hypothetical protein
MNLNKVGVDLGTHPNSMILSEDRDTKGNRANDEEEKLKVSIILTQTFTNCYCTNQLVFIKVFKMIN